MRTMPFVLATALFAACEVDAGRYQREGELGGDPVPPVQLVPSERPAGRVRVDVAGATQVSFPWLGSFTVVNVRIHVANDHDEQAWIVDARHQRLEVRGGRRFAPLPTGEPVASIPRRTARTFDLRFAMPGTVDELRSFEVLWQLTTGTRIVGERTPFRR